LSLDKKEEVPTKEGSQSSRPRESEFADSSDLAKDSKKRGPITQRRKKWGGEESGRRRRLCGSGGAHSQGE